MHILRFPINDKYLFVVYAQTVYFIENIKYNQLVRDLLSSSWSYGRYLMFIISKYDEVNNVIDYVGLSKVI